MELMRRHKEKQACGSIFPHKAKSTQESGGKIKREDGTNKRVGLEKSDAGMSCRRLIA